MKIASDSEEEELQMCVPALFKCPISLELMTDPVSLCTGVTYDRSSIEKWFYRGNNICPATGQFLHTQDLIPNHTLRRFIHKWCVNADPAHKIQPLPEPATVRQLVRDIGERSARRLEALTKLKFLAMSERNRRCLKAEGVFRALIRELESFHPENDGEGEAVQEALAAIALLCPGEDVIELRDLRRAPVIRTLEWILVNGNLESRMNAAAIVETLTTVDKTASREIGSIDGITDGLLKLFKDNAAHVSAVRASLKALFPLCSVVKNRVKIAKAEGVVSALIELIPGAERSCVEASLAILEALSTSSEGRCAIMAHALAVPTIIRSLLVLSQTATDYGIRILLAICFNCGEEETLREIMEMGTFEKLLVVMQIECGQRTKRYANQLLRILSTLPENATAIHSAFSSLNF